MEETFQLRHFISVKLLFELNATKQTFLQLQHKPGHDLRSKTFV